MALTDNCVLYWKLDENEGTTTNDESGSGRHGSMWNTVNWVPGKINSGIGVDNDNATMEYTGGGLDVTTEITINVWIKHYQAPVGDWFLNCRTAGDSPVAFIIANTNTSVYAQVNGTNITKSGLTITTGVWYMHTLTGKRNDTVQISVDAGTPASTALPDADILTSSRFSLCGYGTGDFGADLHGVADECGVWNRVLSSAEITELYNSGDGLQYPFGAAPSGPANLKTYNTNPTANIKTINTNAIANVKSLNTNV